MLIEPLSARDGENDGSSLLMVVGLPFYGAGEPADNATRTPIVAQARTGEAPLAGDEGLLSGREALKRARELRVMAHATSLGWIPF